jgi:hypothetical protein
MILHTLHAASSLVQVVRVHYRSVRVRQMVASRNMLADLQPRPVAGRVWFVQRMSRWIFAHEVTLPSDGNMHTRGGVLDPLHLP